MATCITEGSGILSQRSIGQRWRTFGEKEFEIHYRFDLKPI